MKNVMLYRQTVYPPYTYDTNTPQPSPISVPTNIKPLMTTDDPPHVTMDSEAFMNTNMQELQVVLQHINTGILAQTTTGQIVYTNLSAAKLLGFENVHQLLIHLKKSHNPLNTAHFTYTDLFDNKTTPKDLPWHTIQKHLSKSELTINITNNNTLATKRIHIKSHTIHSTQRTTPIIISILTDISNVALLEKQKDEFISMASHELKTPITSMKVFTQILQKSFSDTTNPKSLYYMGKIDEQLNKLTLLVKELLDVSRLQTGRLKLHKEIFPVDEIITEIAQQMQYTTNRQTIQIKNTFKGNIYGDRERLSQVLVNLLSNAIKYSPDNSSILITGQKQKNKLKIEVIDHGIGISKIHQKNIFDRFARVEDTQGCTFPGMGVGLYIASQIIQRHNGTLSVISKKHHGSTFVINLPIPKNNES